MDANKCLNNPITVHRRLLGLFGPKRPRVIEGPHDWELKDIEIMNGLWTAALTVYRCNNCDLEETKFFTEMSNFMKEFGLKRVPPTGDYWGSRLEQMLTQGRAGEEYSFRR